MLYQRLFLVALLVVYAVLAVATMGYEAAFSYEPVGPRAFPLLLLALLAAGTVYLLFRPGHLAEENAETPLTPQVLGKLVLCVLALSLFAFFFERLGFIVSSFLFAIAMCRLYNGGWITSVITGLVMSLAFYVLFDRVLDVPLPLGVLSGLGS
ncbi:tripartite tricarboxylate transporter TctB family protein [Larsenimonas rhizosphaerae]|uniref:Tripartite tricarboxylate transporter TctB family protein n=1 Tax=Larsenimonas rhizosphaerae TaxID=2944682 RepID=A0AA41ZF34_9GAMM|nr:tripartite tricarboxylate transporter TctB family protein [Larsenimonas rhizosphaerae]MCX2524064.1 tripartite tricarboxylate transporter TctB family protein [Larsenimonas rhizosphaerae]